MVDSRTAKAWITLLSSTSSRHLAGMASALKKKIPFAADCVPVTCSGGLFHAGKWVLDPLKEKLSAAGCRLAEPAGNAVDGAIRLAVEQYTRKEKQ